MNKAELNKLLAVVADIEGDAAAGEMLADQANLHPCDRKLLAAAARTQRDDAAKLLKVLYDFGAPRRRLLVDVLGDG